MKNFLLDTSVILYDPKAILSFEDNQVWIPLVVIEELDRTKQFKDHIGQNARVALRMINRFMTQGNLLCDGVSINDRGGMLRLIPDFDTLAYFSYLERKPDNYILGTAMHMKKALAKDNVVLVTKDINMLVKAGALGIDAEEYYRDNLTDDVQEIGLVSRVMVTTNVMDAIYSFEEAVVDDLSDDLVQPVTTHAPTENGCYIVSDGSRSALMRYHNGCYRRIKTDFDFYGIKPRNAEQTFLADLLMDRGIDCVVVAGTAGTGKTLLSLAAGLEAICERPYDRIMITKTIMDSGQSIGFTPGTKEEKMAEWVKPFYDNLELLMRKRSVKTVQKMFEDGTIEVEALTYMRGRSLMNRWVIFDEAQNLTPKQMKTVVTRISNTSKLIILGDLQQIDHPYLNKNNNGLAHAMAKLSGRKNIAVLSLVKSERGRLAQVAIDCL